MPRREIAALQFDMVGHSSIDLPTKNIQQARELLQRYISAIVGVACETQVSWAGDGGWCWFEIKENSDFSVVTDAAIDVLNSLPVINERLLRDQTITSPLSIRLSAGKMNAELADEPGHIASPDLNRFLKYERDVGLPNRLVITEGIYSELQPRFRSRFQHWKHSPDLRTELFVYASSQPRDDIQVLTETANRYEAVNDRLEECGDGEEVRFIAVTGLGAMLSGARPDRGGQPLLERAFPKALSRGVRFRGILLNPRSGEAEFRSSVETPSTRAGDRLLQRDADFVRNHLWLMYRRAGINEGKIRNLRLRHTDIGIAFGLWIFDDIAFMEPMHFGKREGDEHMCGFCRLKIAKLAFDTPGIRDLFEYHTLERHFEELWSNSKRFSWRRRDL